QLGDDHHEVVHVGDVHAAVDRAVPGSYEPADDGVLAAPAQCLKLHRRVLQVDLARHGWLVGGDVHLAKGQPQAGQPVEGVGDRPGRLRGDDRHVGDVEQRAPARDRPRVRPQGGEQAAAVGAGAAGPPQEAVHGAEVGELLWGVPGGDLVGHYLGAELGVVEPDPAAGKVRDDAVEVDADTDLAADCRHDAGP